MNHAEVHSYMADYLEGELDLTKRALLDAHLDACNRCSGEFAEMRETIGLLRSLPDPTPPPFLVENVMRRVREGEGRLGFFERLREWVGYLATPQVALPAAALGLGLAMATGNLDPSRLGLPGFEPTEQPVKVAAIDRKVVQAPQLAAMSRPPAVSPTPHVTITLPGSGQGPLLSRVASNPSASGANPFYGRRAPRSIRGLMSPLAGSSQGLSTPVANLQNQSLAANRVTDRSAAEASAFAPQRQASGMSRDESRARELDERLDGMIRNPAAFSAEFAAYSVAEQEIWLVALAERARETGRGQEALSVLRGTGDRSALQLATAFSVELQRVDSAQLRLR